MKKLIYLFLLFLLAQSTNLFSQVRIDKQIQLTGNGTDAKLTGIQNVTNTQDATSVGSLQNGSFIYGVSTGSNDTFNLNISPPVNGYVPGMVFNYISYNQSVTSSAFLNINNLGAMPITKYGSMNLTGCEILNGQAVQVLFDGTNFQLISPIYSGTPAYTPVATTGSNSTGSQITANWSASTNATGYYLDVATDSGFLNPVAGFNNLSVGNVITYNITGLNCGATYYYRMRAANICGQSGNSNIISYSTQPAGVPVAIAATNSSASQFTANWNVTSQDSGYYLDVATDIGFINLVPGYNNLNVGNVTNYTVTGLAVGTYYYRVRGYINTSCGISGNSNIITCSTATVIQVLAVAGGGGGGYGGGGNGGGGGAGGYIYASAFTVSPQTYTVTVGNGGGGAPGNGGNGGSNGGNSSFGSNIAIGGGGGGAYGGPQGSDGGSGGGGGQVSGGNSSTCNIGGSGIAGQGYAGGTGIVISYGAIAGCGGGGAGGPGQPAYNTSLVDPDGGPGGVGIVNSISGSPVGYAGGGGGSSHSSADIPHGGIGVDGGGTGHFTSTAATAGSPNTGGGGGGGGEGSPGANGGSGVVIISYPTGSINSTNTGGTVTTANGNTIITFTSNGTWTPQ